MASPSRAQNVRASRMASRPAVHAESAYWIVAVATSVTLVLRRMPEPA